MTPDLSVAAYRQRRSVSHARHIDGWLQGRDAQVCIIRYHVLVSDLRSVGGRLVEFDRESRRAGALVQARWADRGIPRPLPPGNSALTVAAARAGSADFLVWAVGAVSDLLLSSPVQLAITTQALVGNAARLRVWVGRPSLYLARSAEDPLSRISARDALAIYDGMDEFVRTRPQALPRQFRDQDSVAKVDAGNGNTPVKREVRSTVEWSPRDATSTEPDWEVELGGSKSASPVSITYAIEDGQGDVNYIHVDEEWE